MLQLFIIYFKADLVLKTFICKSADFTVRNGYLLSLVLLGFFLMVLMEFVPALIKQILPSDDFCWIIIIFSKTGSGGNPSSCLSNNLPIY